MENLKHRQKRSYRSYSYFYSFIFLSFCLNLHSQENYKCDITGNIDSVRLQYLFKELNALTKPFQVENELILYITEIVDSTELNDPAVIYQRNTEYHEIYTFKQKLSYPLWRFSLKNVDNKLLFDGIMLNDNFLLNELSYCKYLKNMGSSIDTVIRYISEKHNIKIKDTLFSQSMLRLKWSNILPKGFYVYSLELLPDYKLTSEFGDMYNSTVTALVSQSLYSERKNCPCIIYKPVYLIQSIEPTKKFRFKKGNVRFLYSDYVLFDYNYDLIGVGRFTWENVTYYGDEKLR